MAKQDKMIESAKEKSKEKIKYAKEVIDTMRKNGETITVYSLQKKSKLSKSFIYNNKEVMEYLNKYKSEKKYNAQNYTSEDANEDSIKQLKKKYITLSKKTAIYKSTLLKELLAEKDALKQKLDKYEKLVSDGIITIPEDIK